MRVPRVRLDELLVRRGHAPSREKARALVLAGRVSVPGSAAAKPGQLVPDDLSLDVTPSEPYVSRGGIKLAHALDAFEVDPGGEICADIGASTGGFADCLLQRGAASVYAIDVGYGNPVSVIVMDGFVALAGILDHVVMESNIARRILVDESELVENS